MEIYIKVTEMNGDVGWYVDEDGESYINGGSSLEAINSAGYDYLRGTAFKTVRAAKAAAKQAKIAMSWDGGVKPRATFWRYVRGKLVQTTFTKEGKIKP